MSKISISAVVVVAFAGIIGSGVVVACASANSTSATPLASPTSTSIAIVAAEPTTSTAPATKPVVQKSDFDSKVSKFYRQYVASDNPKSVMDRFMTKQASDTTSANSTDFDAVLCAQNTPLSTSVGSPKVTGNKVTVVVTQTWGGSPNQVLTVTGRTSDGLITSITCSKF